MERSEMEKNLEQLKHSLATGEMTGSELVRRLQMMIQQEISKPEKEVDTEFIEACSSLIEHVYPAIAERPDGYYEEQAAKFKVRLQQREKARRRQRILRPVIAVAAVLVIVFLSVGSIRFHWFTMKSTPDQQQLIVQGHEVSVDMVAKAIATHENSDVLETSDLTELEEYLGFSLEYIRQLLNDWRIDSIRSIINRDYILTFFRFSSNETNEIFHYSITWFINPNDTFYSIEQDKEGYIQRINGVEVYYSENVGISSCSWIKDISVHVITAEKISDKIEKAIDLIIRSSS